MDTNQRDLQMKRQAFGLAFDIERTTATKSGFRPAQFDLGSGKELFGLVRIAGWAAMIRLDIVDHLTIVGGDEGRYKEDPINRAVAIREMLIRDYEVDASRVDAVPSKSNTLGNVGIIRDRSTSPSDIVVTNLYHIPRAAMDLAAQGLSLPMIAAEAFTLLEAKRGEKEHNNEGLFALKKNLLIESLGGGPLAERCAEEIQGIADKLDGSYQSRTDATPVTFGTSAKV